MKRSRSAAGASLGSICDQAPTNTMNGLGLNLKEAVLILVRSSKSICDMPSNRTRSWCLRQPWGIFIASAARVILNAIWQVSTTIDVHSARFLFRAQGRQLTERTCSQHFGTFCCGCDRSVQEHLGRTSTSLTAGPSAVISKTRVCPPDHVICIFSDGTRAKLAESVSAWIMWTILSTLPWKIISSYVSFSYRTASALWVQETHLHIHEARTWHKIVRWKNLKRSKRKSHLSRFLLLRCVAAQNTIWADMITNRTLLFSN